MLRFSNGLARLLSPASRVDPLCQLLTPLLKATPVLTGAEFWTWLMNPAFANLPDFLAFPDHTYGDRLIKSDICSLRALARGPKGPPGYVPHNFVHALRRLHAHEIIGRLEGANSYLYVMTPFSYEVLLHNVSYREEPYHGELA